MQQDLTSILEQPMKQIRSSEVNSRQTFVQPKIYSHLKNSTLGLIVSQLHPADTLSTALCKVLRHIIY